jgi:gamma-glutamyl:cysteine ligase YbdK (ATP-grasp superfamily)
VEWIAPELAPPNSTLHIMEIYATLTATAAALGLYIVFKVLTAQARERKNTQNWRNIAISHEELRQIRADVRKHARVDPTYKPRTIGGGR